MHDYISRDTFEHAGRKFRVEVHYDDSGDKPWEREDGHGPVSDWTTRAKLPGERILSSDSGAHRFYDFAAAVKMARADGWDTEPYGQGTRGQRAHRAAEADFKRLRDWCEDRWCYVGVIVVLLDRKGAPTKHEVSLWGIESDCEDYLREVAGECANEILGQLRRCGRTPAYVLKGTLPRHIAHAA